MSASQIKLLTTSSVMAMMYAAIDDGEVSWIDSLVMKVNSTEANEDYAWLGATPAMSKFANGRSKQEISENSFSITNEDFDNSIGFKSKDMRRDKSGQIEIRIGDLVKRAIALPASLLSTLIVNGASELCYDGAYFFDTAHPGKDGDQSNKLTSTAATPAAPTAEEFSNAVIAAIQAMLGFKDEAGEPTNQSATNFVVQAPINMMGVALTAVSAMLGEGGKSASLPALNGQFKVFVQPNARLSWTTKFALFRTDHQVKPFILQEEVPITPFGLGEGTDYEKLNKEHLYGVDWSGNVGYGQWSGAVQVTFE